MDFSISFLGRITIKVCYNELIKKGFNQKNKIFIIGHSLGGESAIDYYINNKDNSNDLFNIQWVILMGSIPTRDVREKTKNLNLLIINWELDGIYRITRTAEEFYNGNYDAKGNLKIIIKNL